MEFDLRADHDLFAHEDLFGLGAATRGGGSGGDGAREPRQAWSPEGDGPFPGIGAEPLRLRSARQAASATFSADGFRATAVTAREPMWLGLPERGAEYETTLLQAVSDRPFGFLAVHRATALILASGRVTTPKPLRPEDYGRPPENAEPPVTG